MDYRTKIIDIVSAIVAAREMHRAEGFNVKTRMDDRTYRLLENIVLRELQPTSDTDRTKIIGTLKEIRNEYV